VRRARHAGAARIFRCGIGGLLPRTPGADAPKGDVCPDGLAALPVSACCVCPDRLAALLLFGSIACFMLPPRRTHGPFDSTSINYALVDWRELRGSAQPP